MGGSGQLHCESHTVIQVSGGSVMGLVSSSVPLCQFAISIHDQSVYVDTNFELHANATS
jgi:hypothetical protein